MDMIREEIPSYFTVILRKSTKVKILETLIFLISIVGISLFFDRSSEFFKIAIISSAIVILLMTPFVYKPIVKPKFILTKTELIIEKSGKQEKISLTNLEQSNDLRFMYLINEKKTPLMISDIFIEELNTQIDCVNKSKKSKKYRDVE